MFIDPLTETVTVPNVTVSFTASFRFMIGLLWVSFEIVLMLIFPFATIYLTCHARAGVPTSRVYLRHHDTKWWPAPLAS